MRSRLPSIARRSDVLVVVVALTAVIVVVYEAKFHAWPGQSVPNGIDWCGRTYDRHEGTIDVKEAFGRSAQRLRLVKHAPPLPPRHPVYTLEKLRRRRTRRGPRTPVRRPVSPLIP